MSKTNIVRIRLILMIIKKAININERSNSCYDILIRWRIYTDFAPILVLPIHPMKASIFSALHISSTLDLFFSREKRCHVSAANL